VCVAGASLSSWIEIRVGMCVCVCARACMRVCVCARVHCLHGRSAGLTRLSLSLSLSLSVRACACVCGVDDSRYYYGPHFMMASIFTIIAGQVFPCAILYLLLHLMLHLIGPFLALCCIS
jgi:hypothetical protein